MNSYCPPPPPRRPRHAHLQRFFRSADTASASSTTTTNGSGTGCGGCSSTVSGNSSSTTMPTMEEGRRMAACWKARNPTNRLYRSVDDDYGGGDQRDRRGAAIFNDHRRLLPDVPTKMPKKSQGQFPPTSSVPRLPPYTMPPPYSYRIPSVQRADPSPLARFNSLKRAKPLRRDFSVDRRTESLFRHFVRPDPFEIL
uniref:Uncharacterized protein n=1 Tax=Globodera pallida TaxID=36090 RepID=A0A183BUL1_GLOPA